MRGDRNLSGHRSEDGFTLIELAVVLVVITVLAALAIPVFLQMRDKADATHVTSALKDGSTAAESWVIAYGGDYTQMTFTGLEGQGYQDSSDVVLDVANVDGTGFCLIATSESLPASDEWRVATYDSNHAAPSANDECPALRNPPLAARSTP